MNDYLTRLHTSVSKGLAILLIVFVHVCAAVLPASIARLATPLGGTGVAVFLFVSGYGLNESSKKHNLEKYWSKKIRGVLIPYLAVFLVYAVIMRTELTLVDGVLLLLTAKDRSDYYFWYIGYQFLCYGLFYLAIKLSVRRSVKYVVLLAGATASFFLFNELRAEQSLSFMLGVLASDCPALKKMLSQRRTFWVMLIIGGGMLALKQLPAVRASSVLALKVVQMLIKLPLAICLIQISWLINGMDWLAQLLRWVGKYSYEIYLAHAVSMLALLYCGSLWSGIIQFMVFTGALVFLLVCFRKILNQNK